MKLLWTSCSQTILFTMAGKLSTRLQNRHPQLTPKAYQAAEECGVPYHFRMCTPSELLWWIEWWLIQAQEHPL